VPLALLFAIGLAPGGVLSLGPLAETLDSRAVQRALWNSLESSLVSALAATVIGTALALLVGLTDIRAKGPLVFLILLPMMIPPHVTAISWIQALGPGSPVLRWAGLAPEPGSTHPIYSAGGLFALLAIQHMPLVFLVVRAALRSFPRELSDAARSCGAGAGRMLARILLPLLAPSLLAGFMLAFVSALGNFGIAALIGIPARYTTLPVLIWRRLASFGPDMLGGVALIALVLAGVAVLALAVQLRLSRGLRNALIGPPQQPLALRLGRWRARGRGGAVAVRGRPRWPCRRCRCWRPRWCRTYGLPLTAGTLTLGNYSQVLFEQSVTLRAFANSTLVAGVAAAGIAGLSVLLGYHMARGRRLAGLAAAQAEIAYAVPGLVISIALILMFLRPLPLIGVSLYNTLGIILWPIWGRSWPWG
jgi:iron(III) transport system permease protein